MYNDQKFLALITARGGSKRVKNKCIRDFHGKPLIAWTIEAARDSKYLDRVVLSSEDDNIIRIAKEFGCEVPFVRPAELASDTASSIEVVEHALGALEEEYDWLVYLQPTSPLRVTSDIDECIEACMKAGADSALSLCEPETSPIVMYNVGDDAKISPAMNHGLDLQTARSQDFPSYYAINGAVYVTRISWFRRTGALFGDDSVGWIMPQERSVNIDTEFDFRMGQLMFELCQERKLL